MSLNHSFLATFDVKWKFLDRLPLLAMRIEKTYK